MYRHSNKSTSEILTPLDATTAATVASSPPPSSQQNDCDLLLERKITLATEGFTTTKFCELVLRDREEFFPKLLAEDSTVSNEDKEKIRGLLAKPFNPYIRRHSALTEKSVKLKSNTLNQHAGWSMTSNMAQKYIHYFGNESSESLLEAYGIVTKNNKTSIDRLNPRICPNCGEGNTQDAKFCSKCKMIMSYEGYQEALESEKKKEGELEAMKEQFSSMQSQIQSLIMAFANMKEQTQFDSMAKTLYDSHILGKEATISTTTIRSQDTTTTPTAEAEATPINSSKEEKAEDQRYNQQQQQKKQKRIQKQVIKAAGRAAFLATTRKGKK